MNKVYISGVISEDPRLVGSAGSKAHLVFPITVSHKSSSGIKHEKYYIHAWDRTAAWGMNNLRLSQRVVVNGYLTQVAVKESEERTRIDVVVTAEEFIPGQLCKTKMGGDVNADVNAAVD